MPRTKLRRLFFDAPINETVTVQGWVRTRRGNKKLSFIALNDGSDFRSLQLVVNNEDFPEAELKRIGVGASLEATGTLVESQGAGQSIEIQVQAGGLRVLGDADQGTYPLQKKGHSLEFLREKAHLRFRTNTFGAVFRIRHTAAFAIHRFFHEKGFVYLHTPIITAADAEGAGEMFRVTTLPVEGGPRAEDGSIDFSQDFFGESTFLTVSGQLNGETAALALSDIYTFGPTFRAENSNTTRHLAEFWMIEPEMAFYDLEATIELANDFLRFVVQAVLDAHYDGTEHSDLGFLQKQYDAGLIERLQRLLTEPLQRMTYTEAVEVLQQSGQPFEFPVDWGTDLQSEHERFLVEQHVKGPLVVTDYPAAIKAFYMRQNEDGKTVAAMDVLVPGMGEIIGGSQREERLDRLTERMEALGLPQEAYSWYLDTRRYGSAPHSGFGLGFERLLLYLTGLTNIRDVIPFPRTPGHVAF